MPRPWLGLVFCVLLTSGCIGPPGVPETTTMTATSAYVNHAGAGSVVVVPEEDTARPESCTIYRNNVSHDDDSCEVRQGPPDHQEDLDVDWHIRGRFQGSDAGSDQTNQRIREKSITAFGEHDHPVAWWNGTRYHPEFRMSIE